MSAEPVLRRDARRENAARYATTGSVRREPRHGAASRRWALNPTTWPEHSLLARLGDRDREALLSLGTAVTYPTRHPMIRQGEPGHHALLVLAGRVKVVVNTEFGRPVLVAVRGPGELFGEMAVLEGKNRSASVISCHPTTALVIKGNDLIAYMARHPTACLTVVRMVSERLRHSNRRRVEMVVCPARTRVVRVLAEMAQLHGRRTHEGLDIGNLVNQPEIASLAGVALSTVEKALQELQRRQLVRRGGRRIVITDPAGLRQFGGLI